MTQMKRTPRKVTKGVTMTSGTTILMLRTSYPWSPFSHTAPSEDGKEVVYVHEQRASLDFGDIKELALALIDFTLTDPGYLAWEKGHEELLRQQEAAAVKSLAEKSAESTD